MGPWLLISRSLLLVGLLASSAVHCQWSLTQYFEQTIITISRADSTWTTDADGSPGTATYVATGYTYPYTSLIPATPTVAQPTAIRTTTSSLRDGNLDWHQIILETGQAQISTGPTSSTISMWFEYVVTHAFTDLPGCSATPTITTEINVPSRLGGLVPTISSSNSTQTLWDGTIYILISSEMAYEDLPAEIQSDIEHKTNISWLPWGYLQGLNVTNPCPSPPPTPWRPYSPPPPWCEKTGGPCLNLFTLIGVILGSWAFLFFLIGIYQSTMRFRDLMRGHEARRGIPTCFACLVPIVLIPVFLLSYSAYSARSADEKAALERRWRSYSIWRKLVLWLKYGFSGGYPAILGTPPPRIRRSGMHPGAAARDAVAARNRALAEDEYELAPPPYSRQPSPPPPRFSATESPASLSQVDIARPPPAIVAGETPPNYDGPGNVAGSSR